MLGFAGRSLRANAVARRRRLAPDCGSVRQVAASCGKKGIPVDDIQTLVERDDSAERGGVYRLSAKLKIHGKLTDAQLQELQAVAEKCPVHKLMTQVTTEITTEVERLS